MKNIIDVSSVVYAGYNGRPNLQMSGFPVGGIHHLFRLIASCLPQGSIALCFDGGKIIKKELLPTYKAGRVPDYSVIAQIDVIKSLLTACNIPFYYNLDYEADDFIYSLCAELELIGDKEEISIHSDDHDIACNVSEKRQLCPVSRNGALITRDNYTNRVVRGHEVPYNTILLWKMFYGDSSDNYKGLKIPGLNFDTVASDYVNALEPLIGPEGFTTSAYASYEIFEAYSDAYGDQLSDTEMKEFLNQARIAFPYQVDVYRNSKQEFLDVLQQKKILEFAELATMNLFDTTTINTDIFDFLASSIGPRGAYKRKSRKYTLDGPEGEQLKEFFRLKAQDLSSGVLAAESYNSRHIIHPEEITLQNMELPV